MAQRLRWGLDHVSGQLVVAKDSPRLVFDGEVTDNPADNVVAQLVAAAKRQ